MAYTRAEIQLIVEKQIGSIKESLCENLRNELCKGTDNKTNPLGEKIQLVVEKQIDSIKDSLCDNLWNELHTNKTALIIDTNLLGEDDKKALIKYVDDKGIIDLTNISEKAIINLCLEISAQKGCLENVNFLVVEKGADINGTSALIKSVENGHLDIVIYLVEQGAVVDGRYLTIGARNGHLNIVKYLVNKKVKFSAPVALCSSARNGHLDVVKYFVEQGVAVNSTDALSNGAHGGHLDVVKYLVEQGAVINGTNALRYSAMNGHFDVVKYLVEQGAVINGTNALRDSAANKHSEIVKFLIESIASIDGTNTSGN